MATDHSGIKVSAVRWEPRPGQEHFLNVHITPLMSDGELLGTSVAFSDITGTRKLQEQLMQSKHELEQAYEELQSTVEELETTNEELQSTNEELETTNEELHSTNEELETMNEELHSANEELETMNDELRSRSSELGELNVFLETILGTVGLAVAVLDKEQHVQIWNGQAREMWGLIPEEVEGRHLHVTRLRVADRAAQGPDPQHPGRQLGARGGSARCDQPPRADIQLPGHVPAADSERRRRQRRNRHDGGRE